MKLQIKLLNEKAQMPKKANPTDAAFDCYVNSIEVDDFGIVKVGLGFAVEVPEGYQLNLTARSSIGKTGWVLGNGIGIIDSGYKDEVFAVFYKNLTYIISYERESNMGIMCNEEQFMNGITKKYFPYKIGERCCQIFLQEIIPTELIQVDEIKGERSGYGSTGKY